MNIDRHCSTHSILYSTHSFDSANQCLNKIIGPHELLVGSDNQSLNFSFEGQQMGGIIMGDLAYGKDVVFKTQHQQDMHFYCITRPKRGRPIFRHQQRILEVDHGNGAIVSPFDKFEIEIEGDCVQSFISISKPLLENTLSDLIQRPIHAPIEFDQMMSGQNERINAWWNLIDYLGTSRKQQMNFDCLMKDIKYDFEKILAKSLLLSQPHNYSYLINTDHSDDPEFLKRALNYIHDNIQHQICSDDLEHITGVSKQKISKVFRDRMQVSVNSYIRYYRLKCIYQELATAQDKKNVTNIAMKWGINHLGRFSIEYKQQFGESPSDTVRKSLLQLKSRLVHI